ncbi:MAG TPA: hypothetical protein VGA42_04085, partial [Gemmatimonadales bacterium]
MDDPRLRVRLVDHALAGRYGGFVRGGTLATVVGLVLFLVVLLSDRADRAWHAFHWNWLFFT